MADSQEQMRIILRPNEWRMQVIHPEFWDEGHQLRVHYTRWNNKCRSNVYLEAFLQPDHPTYCNPKYWDKMKERTEYAPMVAHYRDSMEDLIIELERDLKEKEKYIGTAASLFFYQKLIRTMRGRWNRARKLHLKMIQEDYMWQSVFVSIKQWNDYSQFQVDEHAELPFHEYNGDAVTQPLDEDAEFNNAKDSGKNEE